MEYAEMIRDNYTTAEEKMESIFQEYGDGIFRVCVSMLGDYQMVEDAFQETMVRIWRSLSTFRGESSLKTWITRIAINTCRDFLKSNFFRQWKSMAPPEENIRSMHMQDTDVFGEVTEAISGLPQKYREVIVLRYYKELSLKEIGDILEIPVFTVSTRLRKARELLQKKLKDLS